MLWQPPLDTRYTAMDATSTAEAIESRRSELGERLIILGHHYQQDEVIRHADFTGDSFKLAQLAAEQVAAKGAEHVVFVSGGFCEVRGNTVRIVSEAGERPEEIDKARAEEARKRAEERIAEARKLPPTAEVDLVRAEAALRRALFRLHVRDHL